MNIPTISIVINNKSYDVRANASILQACEEIGIHLPRFCYHEKLSVAGNCRICLVEVEKSPKPVVSCAMPVSKGMVIYTDTPLVKKVRESVIEFLLINHPLDCPICDQGGECDLQDETLEFGSDRSRFYEFKRTVEDKEVGPIVKTIMTRCIHCTRCVRFSSEIAGQEVMGSFNRGEETEIGTYVQKFIKTELSGNLVDICPVGALTSKPYAYRARSWELQKVDTIDFFDGLCTDIVVQTRAVTTPGFSLGNWQVKTKDEIIRILPRTNGLYQDNWISDKTRHAFDGLRNQRITNTLTKDTIIVGKHPLIADLITELTCRLTLNTTPQIKSVKIGAVIDSLVDLEGLYVLNEVLKHFGGTTLVNTSHRSFINFDIPNFYTLNRSFNSLSDLTSLLLIGTNTRFEASLLNTAIRKHQLARDLNYATIGVYSDLKMKQNHLGVTSKTLLNLVTNKVSLTKNLVNTKGVSVFLGHEILKGKNGGILQNITRFLAKKLFLKTKTGERLSILHANTTSLVFNTLGVNASVRDSFYVPETRDKKLDLLFAVQPFNFQNKKWISTSQYTHIVSLGTHRTINLNPDRFIPLKTFYEKDGFLVNIEGRLRKFYKSVTAPERVVSLETFFITLLRAHSLPSKWLSILSKLWRFNDEIVLTKNLEKLNETYSFTFFDYKEPYFLITYTPFNKPISNFYTTDQLSVNSITMAEASLFLNKNRNFY